MTNGVSIGIMQGRLSPVRPGGPQAFPFASWRDEFARAAEIGFNALEWLVELDRVAENPIWSAAGRAEINGLQTETGVSVRSLCAHYFVQWRPFDADTTEMPAGLLSDLVACAAEIGITRIVVPLVEEASVARAANMAQVADRLAESLRRAEEARITLAFESDLSAERCIAFLDELGSPAASLCFDIGNATAMGLDVPREAAMLLPRIAQFHVKDRVVGGTSRPLGQGDAPLAAVAKRLAAAGWDGPMILETPAGDDWHASAVANLATTQYVFAGKPARETPWSC